MKTFLALWSVAFTFLFASADALAQKQTEQYIPIGKSPGLSGKYTSMGTIDAADAQKGTLSCTGTSGPLTVKVTKNTRIWIDRSKLGLKNLVGKLGDCRRGSTVEVKFRNNDRAEGVAEWIKVEGKEGGS